MENMVKGNFFDRVLEVLKNARKQAKMALNISMVYSYYEVGRMIVEEEQNGKQRVHHRKHAKGLIHPHSAHLPALSKSQAGRPGLSAASRRRPGQTRWPGIPRRWPCPAKCAPRLPAPRFAGI
mgnify:CR=1 FL=1